MWFALYCLIGCWVVNPVIDHESKRLNEIYQEGLRELPKVVVWTIMILAFMRSILIWPYIFFSALWKVIRK